MGSESARIILGLQKALERMARTANRAGDEKRGLPIVLIVAGALIAIILFFFATDPVAAWFGAIIALIGGALYAGSAQIERTTFRAINDIEEEFLSTGVRFSWDKRRERVEISYRVESRQ